MAHHRRRQFSRAHLTYGTLTYELRRWYGHTHRITQKHRFPPYFIDGGKSYDEPAYIRQTYDTGSAATVTVQYVNVRGSLDAYRPARFINKVGGALALLADRVVIGEPYRACAKIVYASS